MPFYRLINRRRRRSGPGNHGEKEAHPAVTLT
jgi:hypothetical protein